MAVRKKKITGENEPYVLPTDMKELNSFISNYKVDMTEQVVSSIEFALKNKLPIIEIFQFKGTNYVVTMMADEFKLNLNNIYKFYLQKEHYELCNRIIKLINKIEKINEKKKISPKGIE